MVSGSFIFIKSYIYIYVESVLNSPNVYDKTKTSKEKNNIDFLISSNTSQKN